METIDSQVLTSFGPADFKIYFSRKIRRKISRFLLELCSASVFLQKKLIITLVFEKNAIFSPKKGENRAKLLSKH
jgi:hypothetical protein